MMGPSLPKKGKGSSNTNKSQSQRGLTSAGQDSSTGTRSSLAISNAGTNTTTTTIPATRQQSIQSPPTDLTTVPSSGEEASSPTLTHKASISTADDWNFKRYQREDEELWGHGLSRTGQQLMDAIKQAGTSAGRFMEAKLGKDKPVTDEDRQNFYFTPKNPPVNDYHPPVVSSKPAHRDGHRWMLQPPPPAKVMEGKVPVNRTASMASMASSRRTVRTSDGVGLSRLVGERVVDAKLRKGATSADGMSRSTSPLPRPLTRKTTATSSARSRSQRTARSRSHSLSTESDPEPEASSESKMPPKPKARIRPRAIRPADVDSDPDSDDDVWVSRSLESLSRTQIMPHQTHAAQRPRLSTILSSEQKSRMSSMENESNTTTAPLPLRDISNIKTTTRPSSGSDNKSHRAGDSEDSGLALQP